MSFLQPCELPVALAVGIGKFLTLGTPTPEAPTQGSLDPESCSHSAHPSQRTHTRHVLGVSHTGPHTWPEDPPHEDAPHGKTCPLHSHPPPCTLRDHTHSRGICCWASPSTPTGCGGVHARDPPPSPSVAAPLCLQQEGHPARLPAVGQQHLRHVQLVGQGPERNQKQQQ